MSYRIARLRGMRRHGYCGSAAVMNADNREGDPHRQLKDPTATQANGSPHTKRGEFARRAKGFISQLPPSLDAQMKRSPYTTLGIALAVGMGAGILLRSRILRSVLVSAASYAVIELGRAYLRET